MGVLDTYGYNKPISKNPKSKNPKLQKLINIFGLEWEKQGKIR